MVRQKSASCQLNTVNYDTADGTATVADGDYVAASVTVTVLPGVTSQPVTGTDNCAPPFEPNETFFVNLSNPVNATISDNQGVGTIVNDDGQPTISISDVSQNEGNAGPTVFTFTRSEERRVGKESTAEFATADGKAKTAEGDYVGASGTVTFLPGFTTQTVPHTINYGDKIAHICSSDLNLSNPVNATISDNQGAGTIVNDDGQPTISISDVSQNEGNAGPTVFTFTVSLSSASSLPITVNYATADGTATVADGDYVAASGTVTFLPGVTSQPVAVTVNGDTKFEPNETFFVNLSNPVNATISDNQGAGTIVNDDGQPTISISDVSQNEGNVGPTVFTFTVSLSSASFQTITVNYATADGTATVADGDYVAASGTVTFLPGVTSQPVAVTVNGDTKFEPNETFFVNLSNPVNATISDNQGVGTIVNDDGQPTISISDVSQNE